MAYEPKKFTPAELTELHALPDDSLLTAQEASAFLRLKYGSWVYVIPALDHARAKFAEIVKASPSQLWV